MHFNNVIGTVNRYVIQIKRDKFPSWTGGVPRQMNEVNLLRRGGGIRFKIHHPVTCLRQASSFACTFGAVSFVPPLLSRRGIFKLLIAKT